MDHHHDFEELLLDLSSERAEFLVVGAYAVMTHTEPRYTKDLDIWVRPTKTNAKRVFRALKTFGARLTNVTPADLARPGVIFQIGVEPVRIDIITEIDGLTFQSSMANSVETRFGKARIAVLSIADLIRNKTAVGRPQDLLDLEKLRAAVPPKKARPKAIRRTTRR